jgi:hypothetical protein
VDPRAGLGSLEEEKILLLPGSGPKTFKIVANRYTDYIIAAPHSPKIHQHSIIKFFNTISSALFGD